MPNDFTALLSGSYWTGIEVTVKPVIVTYSFPTAAPSYFATLDDPNLTLAALATYQSFTAPEAQMARDALAEWGAACGVTFIEVAAGSGDINFQKLDFSGTGHDGAGGIGYRPFGDWDFASYPYFTSDLDTAGDVFMNSDIAVTYGTLLHEIGHALGLKHPTEDWTQWAASPPVVHSVWDIDDPALTIMSQLSGGTGHLTAIDIQAVQAIYGTPAQDGTQVASWSFNATRQTLTQTGFVTDDAIRGSSVKDVMLGLGGHDRLYGLNGNDRLTGGAGNDTLDGGPGNDRLTGGTGDDTFIVTGPGDKVIEGADAGTDTVIAATSHTLASGVEVLFLQGADKLKGTGNDLHNSLFAGSGEGLLNGMAGDDYLVGGAARDQITGGQGSDLMFGGALGDQFIFTAPADFTLDAIGDFSRPQGDKISLKGIDPDAITPGDQKFSFIGTAAFTTDTRFQVRAQTQGTDVLVQIDLNQDTMTDATILLYGVTSLTAADFLL